MLEFPSLMLNNILLYIPHFIHPFFSWWAVRLLSLLASANSASINRSVQWSECLLSIFWGIYPGLGLLDHTLILCLTFWRTTRLFHSSYTTLHRHKQCPSFSASLPTLVCPPFLPIYISYLFLIVILVCVRWHLIVISICISLMISAKIFLCTYWPFVSLPWGNAIQVCPFFMVCFLWSHISHPQLRNLSCSLGVVWGTKNCSSVRLRGESTRFHLPWRGRHFRTWNEY